MTILGKQDKAMLQKIEVLKDFMALQKTFQKKINLKKRIQGLIRKILEEQNKPLKKRKRIILSMKMVKRTLIANLSNC